MNLETWKQTFDQRCNLDDLTAFEAEADIGYGSMPGLKQAVPALDALEAALQPWGENRERENQCMQLLLAEQGKRLLQLNALHGLHRSVIDEAWSATALPSSFRWIPALSTAWNQSAHADQRRTGLWWNDRNHASESGVILDGGIDERGIPEISTALAIAQLEKFQRRFPNDPHRVLVAYVKGMAFATRWSGKPGYDDELDEWLALYKVISRMMVNTDLPNLELDWIEVLSNWERVTCNGEIARNEWVEQRGLPSGVLSQFLPWWTGSVLPCAVIDSYNVVMPASYVSRWNADSPSPEVATNRTTPPDASSTGGQSEDYTVAYTCQLHEVKAGDTLWNISKRYPGTTPEWIAEINEITDYIRIGDVLCIPIQP